MRAGRAGARGRWRVPRAVRLFLPVAFLLTTLYAAGHCSWTTTAPLGEPEWGVNFSCKRAEHFGQDCETLFARVLAGLGVRHVRLSVYWSDVEQTRGVYDFSRIDRLLEIARAHGAAALVTVGMKAQRYPEFWFPTWLRLEAQIPPDGYPEDNALVQAALFPYLEAAARHIGAHPAVEAVQVENEPLVHFEGHANGWRLRKSFLLREIETVRAALPRPLPIVVSHASWLRTDDSWRWILDHADVVAQSVYTKRQRGPWSWLYIYPYRLGVLTPNLPGQVHYANRSGKQLWIGELQAEPYEGPDVDVRRIPSDEAGSFSPRWLDENVALARRSGASRAYLWGVEWWAYARETRHELRLWEAAKEVLDGVDVRGRAEGR